MATEAHPRDPNRPRLLRAKPRRSRTLAGKLGLLEETSDDAELRDLAVRLHQDR
jgi:hypothetical protein